MHNFEGLSAITSMLAGSLSTLSGLIPMMFKLGTGRSPHIHRDGPPGPLPCATEHLSPPLETTHFSAPSLSQRCPDSDLKSHGSASNLRLSQAVNVSIPMWYYSRFNGRHGGHISLQMWPLSHTTLPIVTMSLGSKAHFSLPGTR